MTKLLISRGASARQSGDALAEVFHDATLWRPTIDTLAAHLTAVGVIGLNTDIDAIADRVSCSPSQFAVDAIRLAALNGHEGV